MVCVDSIFVMGKQVNIFLGSSPEYQQYGQPCRKNNMCNTFYQLPGHKFEMQIYYKFSVTFIVYG